MPYGARARLIRGMQFSVYNDNNNLLRSWDIIYIKEYSVVNIIIYTVFEDPLKITSIVEYLDALFKTSLWL